jgi:membrane fusion protein (multidrug efflux system)
VDAVLPDGTPYPVAGQIGFIDPVVDAQTGTQQYRAQFANPDHLLLPGQFVHVHVRGITRDNAIVIPQRAVLQQMGRQVVYVVGPTDSVTTREVKATNWLNNAWLIESGLAAGDRVIVDGIQKARPGSLVHATPAADSTVVAGTAGGVSNTPAEQGRAQGRASATPAARPAPGAAK